jgi:formylglycine-generating enzyme required for sulfatase activity
MLRTSPPGAKVFQHEELLGITPLELPKVKTGDVEYDLRSDGYTDLVVEGEVVENEMLELFADMDARRGVTFGREWKNSMGMKLLPLGEILMGVWETRRRDYMEFVKGTGGRKPPFVGVEPGKGSAMPVVGVDREEARAFCGWLTKKERDLNLIGKDDRYRLPTDEEWSRAVGLPLERGSDPAERNGRISGVYPWGYEWPPPNGVDNFADETAAKVQGLASFIRGYRDKTPSLANVTTIAPGPKGFVGLAGNASEWVETDYNLAVDPKKPVLGTVRGGNWRSANAEELLSSARLGLPPETRRDTIGFRVVLTHKAGGAPAVAEPAKNAESAK